MAGRLVLTCGSRSWTDAQVIRDRLAKLPRGSTVLHGGARGADRLAGTIAASLGFQVDVMPADWSKGRGAGIARNLAMLDRQPDLVIAFWDGRSTGTGHTITAAQARGIAVEVVRR